MSKTVQSLQIVIKLLIIIAAAALIVMMVIVVANIAGRVFFNTPVLGAVELAGLTGSILVAVAIGIAERDRRTIVVDIVSSRFSPRLKTIAGSITLFLSLIALGIICWATFNYGILALTSNDHSIVLEISTAPFKFFWALGLLILGIYVLLHMIEIVRKGINK